MRELKSWGEPLPGSFTIKVMDKAYSIACEGTSLDPIEQMFVDDDDFGLGDESPLPDNELGLLSDESVGGQLEEWDGYLGKECVSCDPDAKDRTKKSDLLPWGPKSTSHHCLICFQCTRLHYSEIVQMGGCGHAGLCIKCIHQLVRTARKSRTINCLLCKIGAPKCALCRVHFGAVQFKEGGKIESVFN